MRLRRNCISFPRLPSKAVYILKAVGRRVRWAPADILENRRSDGRKRPPRSLSFVGAGDFDATGRKFVNHFVELGKLDPSDHVLDVGCGIGRMAIPLTDYLEGGRYEGFDVGRDMIRWCQRNITPEHPNFRFTWAPVFNQKYNPFGSLSASEFQFPYEDDSFDFVFATSLFTHLPADEVRHYLEEVCRVLRPGATCLLTFFVITKHSAAEIAAGRSALAFGHRAGGGLTVNARRPEEAIAFEEAEIRAMLDDARLTVTEPIHYGRWANTPDALSFQDLVVASRAVNDDNC